MEFVVFSDTQYFNNPSRSKILSNGRSSWLEEQINITKKIFQYAIDNKVEYVIHNGDLFEERSKVNVSVFSEIWNLYFAYRNSFKLIINQGNHDIVSESHREKSYLTSFNLLAKDIIFHPKDFVFEDTLIRIVPFDCYNHLKLKNCTYKNKILFTHANIDTWFPNQPSIDSDDLKDWDLVINGHIHKHSMYKNIVNIGSFMRQDFSEEGDTKFFGHWKDGKLNLIDIDCPRFITLDSIPENFDNDRDYFRINIDQSMIDDPIFERFNVTPNIIQQDNQELRLQSKNKTNLTLEDELNIYIELFKPDELDEEKLRNIGKELIDADSNM